MSPFGRLYQTLLNAKIQAQLECAICSEIMYVPYLASCGHSFCYGCLNSWFTTKLSCPTCRKELDTPPVLNMPLRAISNVVVAVLVEKGGEEGKHLGRISAEAEREHLDAVRGKRVFDKIFESTAMTLVDTSDGVPRCGNCHWEAHGSLCMHCGARFRIPRDDDYYDSEDGDAYNEDDEEIMVEQIGRTDRNGWGHRSFLYGNGNENDNDNDNENEVHEVNEYDTEDSFINNDDVSEAGDNESDSSGNELEWSGFRNGDLASGSDGEGDEDVDTAISNFNSGVIEIDSDGPDLNEGESLMDVFRNNSEDVLLDRLTSRGRRHQVIGDSDDE